MKILAVGPQSKGGIATVIQGITSNYAQNAEIHVTPFTSCLPMNYAKPIKVLYAAFAYLRLLLFYRGYDIYHIHMASYGSCSRKQIYIRALKALNRNVIVHIHGGGFLQYYETLSSQKKKKLRDTLCQADVVIALSSGWKEAYERELGLPNVVVLHNCVGTVALEAAKSPENTSEVHFLFLSKMCPNKGVYDLIEALRVLKEKGIEVLCDIAGNGEENQCRDLVKKNNLDASVKVYGWVDGPDKLELLRKATVVVLPSYAEALPMVLLESMAAGKAVISTFVGAIPQLVEDGVNGLLVHPGAVDELVEAIEHIYCNPTLIHAMSAANIKKVQEHYSSQSVYAQLTEIYKRLG